MTKIQVAVVTRIGMGTAEMIRFRPRLEGIPVAPDGVRGKQRVIVRFSPAQKMKFDESFNVFQQRIPAAPDFDKGVFEPFTI